MRMASATHRLLHHGRRSVAPAVVVMIRFARHVTDRLAFLREERHGDGRKFSCLLFKFNLRIAQILHSSCLFDFDDSTR